MAEGKLRGSPKTFAESQTRDLLTCSLFKQAVGDTIDYNTNNTLWDGTPPGSDLVRPRTGVRGGRCAVYTVQVYTVQRVVT